MKAIITLLLASAITACASFNDAMTPGVEVTTDQFNGARVVVQEPVSAASGMSDAYHMLGFRWDSNDPEVYLLTVTIDGIHNISGLEFNIDGDLVTNIKMFDRFTDRDLSVKYGSSSYKRFSVDRATFEKIAGGRDVKMKVIRGNDYTVSAFGSDHEYAIVNKKFIPFLDSVSAQKPK